MASKTIQIADKPTLDETKALCEAIEPGFEAGVTNFKTLQTQADTNYSNRTTYLDERFDSVDHAIALISLDGLNHYMWANDYKAYGTKSYVYNDKRKLYELLADYEICANDTTLFTQSYAYAMSAGLTLSEFFSYMYDATDAMKSCESLTDIIGDAESLKLIASNKGLAAIIEPEIQTADAITLIKNTCSASDLFAKVATSSVSVSTSSTSTLTFSNSKSISGEIIIPTSLNFGAYSTSGHKIVGVSGTLYESTITNSSTAYTKTLSDCIALCSAYLYVSCANTSAGDSSRSASISYSHYAVN